MQVGVEAEADDLFVCSCMLLHVCLMICSRSVSLLVSAVIYVCLHCCVKRKQMTWDVGPAMLCYVTMLFVYSCV